MAEPASPTGTESFDAFPTATKNTIPSIAEKAAAESFDQFPAREPPTLGQAATAVGQGALGGFAESAPILGGMAAGAQLGALGGPAAPLTVPLGAAAGATAGYFFGKEARGLLSHVPGFSGDPLTTPSVDAMDPRLRPYGVAGEVVGQGLPFVGAPLTAAARGARLPDSLVGRWINRIVDFAAKAPGTFLGSEAAGLSGAAVGGAVAEAYRPGDTLARVGGEVAGGFFNPTRIVVGGGKTALDAGRRMVQSFSPAARQTRAAQILQSIVTEAGEDPVLLARLLRDSGIPGTRLTAAQRTGSPALASLEAKLASESAKFSAESRKMAEESLGGISDMIGALRGTGDPNALVEAAKLRDHHFRTLLAGRVQMAEKEAFEAARRITQDTPAARAEISRLANTAVHSALEEARTIERQLWERVPRTAEASADNVIARYDRIRSQILPEEELPPVVDGFVRRMRGGEPGSNVAPPSSGEMLRFRSRALALAREADAQGKSNDARILGEMAEAALDDLSAIGARAGGAVDEARAFSRELHDTFTRTFAGSAMATNARGADRIPPELMLRRALASGKEAGDLRLADLEEATRFLQPRGAATAETADNIQTMLNAQERLVRLAAADAIDPNTGRVSATRLGRFLRDNEKLLDRFPEVRGDLQQAVKTEAGLRDTQRLATGATRAIERQAAFARLAQVENPIDAVRGAIGGGNPVADLAAFAKVARRGGPEAVDGLKSAVWDHALRQATNAAGDMSIEKLSTTLFRPVRPGQPSIAGIMQRAGVLNADDLARTRRLVDEAGKIEAVLKSGTDLESVLDAPDALFEMVLRIAGARLGAKMAEGGSGATLIAASRGSSFARDVFAKVPQTRVLNILTEAMLEPKLAAALLTKPQSPKEGLQLARQIHAYLLQTGLTAADGDSKTSATQ